MGFSSQEYWSGSPLPSSGDLPDPGPEPTSPALESRFFTTDLRGKPPCMYICVQNIEMSLSDSVYEEDAFFLFVLGL